MFPPYEGMKGAGTYRCSESLQWHLSVTYVCAQPRAPQHQLAARSVLWKRNDLPLVGSLSSLSACPQKLWMRWLQECQEDSLMAHAVVRQFVATIGN